MIEKHPGFLHVAQKIAKREGISLLRAKAELAASTRGDSKQAKEHNPRLLRVKGE